MGDRLTEEDSPKQPSQTPYGDTFDELCPHYLAMGMPYDLYWDGEVGSKTAYRKAYQIQMESKQRMTDQANWNMGQYIIAVLQAVPLFVGGLNTKGVNLPTYPDKPILEKHIEEKNEEDRRKKEEDQQKLAMAMFQAMVTSFNKNTEGRKAREEHSIKQKAGQ